jgi:hypothetical protein
VQHTGLIKPNGDFMELTKEQLDAVEAVKGKRNPALWDPRCEKYMATKSKSSSKNAVKVDSTS